MTALAWLVFAAIVVSLALLPLTYIVQDWAARKVDRHVDLTLAPLTVTDDDFAEYADQAIALTLPLAPLQAAAFAHAEAVRFDPNAVDWTETTEEHR